MDELLLNEGNDQRIVFIAANFRREVTTTVLWLREHQIDARCVKVVPYRHGDEIFLDLQQVIPTPEAADYMIRMAEKDTEQKSAKGAQRLSHQLRHDFWDQVLEDFRSAGLERWQNINPGKDHWLNSGVGVSGCALTLIFLRNEIRVECQLNRPDAEENKWLFDQLHQRREEFAEKMREPLEWRRLDHKKISRIVCRTPVQSHSKENWPDMIDWLREHYVQMEAAFGEAVRDLAARLRPGSAHDEVRL